MIVLIPEEQLYRLPAQASQGRASSTRANLKPQHITGNEELYQGALRSHHHCLARLYWRAGADPARPD